jgi:hypothetical protein
VASHPSGAIRLGVSRVEFCIPADDGRVVDVGFGISDRTSHALRHLLAAQVDPGTGQRLYCARRTLLERALQAAGAAIERVEVLPGEPARLLLAIVTPDGVVRRIDLDLLDAAELLASHRVTAVAIGWPERDWDRGLRELPR